MSRHEPQPEEILIEFRRIGAYVKVSALDPVSMIEVSITGDAAAGEKALTDLAVRKLLFRLRKDGLIT